MRESAEDVVSVPANIRALNRRPTRQCVSGTPSLLETCPYVICASTSSSLNRPSSDAVAFACTSISVSEVCSYKILLTYSEG